MFVLTGFLPAVGEDVSLPPVPILGPGGVRRPEGDIGRAVRLERLEVELEGVESIEVRPSGDVGLEGKLLTFWCVVTICENSPGEAGGVTMPGEGVRRVSSLSPMGSVDEAWKEVMVVVVAKGPRGATMRGFSGGFIINVLGLSEPRVLPLPI